MILEGSVSSDKTDMLIEKYAKLLNAKVPASKILVLVQNSQLKNKFVENTLNLLKINAVEKLENSCTVMLTPQGEPFNNKICTELAGYEQLILLCGHYEGFDERIRSICDLEISIGDYVLTGGELASMVITDSIVRLLPGVIEEGSHQNDSFSNHLLDYPTYTKPRVFRGMEVPEVLVSGDHKKIEEYRRAQSLERTINRRPDLLEK